GDEAEWQRYERAIQVPLGDRMAREELESDEPSEAVVRDGFLQGGNHPEDIAGMIRLFRWFGSVDFMDR
ncbi:MAG: GGDEF domain-containing protein, partial [Gammaproteobacteria bacterium]|nr:GGDEF domain-containing protein [Gammaproteobacteria bacterium]